MIVADTSVLVAAFASWHERHAEADAALAEPGPMIGHCTLETYSVLTRLPPPHRVSPAVVLDFLRDRGDGRLLVLSDHGHAELLERAVAGGIQGGAVYDALVAATAAEAGALLVSCDARATSTYDACGVEARLLTG